MGHDEVAIIGAAGLLPGTDGLTGFHERLREGYDGIGQPSAYRLYTSGGAPEIRYVPLGYLDRVDLFDHRFFGLSLREAELMDPHQRLVLQLAHEAVENAGYAPRTLRGSRTAVVLSEASSAYETLFQGSDPQQILGSIPAAIAARVSYLFDFVGPALVVDTACSSSLSAVALAVGLLRGGDVHLALAGGVSVQSVLTPQREHEPLRGVESPTGTCRPFDARADGTVGGEGGGIVMLKLLSKALADRDHVIGVLKGIAVNHNGYRAASMGAPSQVAQAEVIAQAWRDAGVEARSIGYVECHGSATPLGDVVEVDALRRAFLDAGVDTPHCTIGSVKGNIGHLGNASGMAGLFKALCSVRHGVLYPAVHFETPNSLIDFSGPVQVNGDGRYWLGESSTPRRAGVSSFGLTGTNVHTVLEQALEPDPSIVDEQAPVATLVTVSAKSSAALAQYCQRLADFVEATEHSIRSVAHVMNRGRDDHPYRLAFAAADKRELADALRAAVVPEHAVVQDSRVVLLFSADARIDESSWSQLCGELPELGTAVDELGKTDTSPQGLLVRRQWALWRLISSLGLTDPDLVGNGTGNLVVRCAQGELSTRDALLAAAGATASTEIDRSRLRQAVQGFRRSGAVLVEMGADGALSREMRRMAPELPTIALLDGAGHRGLLEQLGRIYTLGGTFDWKRYYERAGIPRIEAPTYPFEPVRCWVQPAGIGTATGETANNDALPPRRTGLPPGADTVRHVAAVWEDVLKVTDLHPESDYFALGGTSIAGISVLRRLEQDLGVELSFADLYAYRTVRSLADRVDQLRSTSTEREADRDRSITPIRRGGRLPLSFGQEQLWYLDCLNPGSPLYNIPTDLRLRGPLDIAALRGALQDLATRHEVLRTCIRSDDGDPYVHVLPAGPELPLLDLSLLPPAERDPEGLRLAEAEALRTFDLAEGPLLRTTLLKLGENDHVLLYTYHHIIFDGWSPSVFFRDFFELYRARRTGQPAELPELPIQYADFAAWQRSWLSGQRLETGLSFWRDQLAGLRNGELPLDRPRPATQSFAGDLVEFTIDVELATRVREFSQRQGVTTFVTMLAVVDALLHRWAHLDDVVVGVGTSGRVNPATHELIGYFNNLPPFRTTVSGALPFTELVRRCADTVAGVLDHEEMPLEKIVSAVCRRRDPARHPVFDVAYTYQNAPAPTGDLPGLTITRYLDRNIAGIAPGTAKFDLTFGVTDQGGVQMHAYIEYAVALFDRETAQRLADWLPAILDAAMTNPQQRIDQLPESPHRPTEQPSALTGVRPDSGDGRLVWEMVEAQAAERPDHPAVVSDGCVHSYREINRMANRLARRLVDADVTAETVVPAVVGRGVELVVAWLAVAKAGGAYVPIDPGLPRQRISEIVAETGAVVVVGNVEGRLEVPIELTSTDEVDDENPSRRAYPRNLAYVAYTSGSTGWPHGCEIEHRNLVDLVRWYRNEVCLSTEDNTLQVASPGFDIAALEVWASLCSGATVHFLPTALEEPGKLVRWLADHRVTVAFLPTQLAEIVLTDCEWPQKLCLRVLSTGGDQLRTRPPANCPFRLLNMYGPTECTVVSTAGEVGPAAKDELPDIGRPIAGTSVYVIDSRGTPVAAGGLGEIYVGGAAVGRGYHGLASLTATRFVLDPFSDTPGARMYGTGDLGRLRPDGTVEFSGRIDDQVEVRGQRVEPAEVERVLVAYPSVHEALVVAAIAPSGSTQLIANVTTALPPPAVGDLIAWAARALPSYMVPSQIVMHERLPRTATGKLDRKGMKEMTMSTTTLRTTTNGQHADEAAQILARICADLLSVDRVGPDDNFFEIGGDSVLGVRLAARAAKAGVHFTPQQMLQHHTLRELAATAMVTDTGRTDEGSAPAATVTARPVVRPGAPIHLTPIMHSFLDRMPHDVRDFLTVHPLETTTRIGGEIMRAAVDHLVARHEPLRYRFRRNSLGWRIDCAEPGTMDIFDVQVLPPMSEQEELAVLAADLEELRSRIDLERGPALRVRYYDRGHNRNGWIVFVIHHFVFDNMATIVLIDDLDAVLADITAGRPPDPPRPSQAWREWSQHLQDIAVSDELAGELTYWTGILRAGAATIATDAPARAGTAGAVCRNLDPDRVAKVLKGGRRADEAAMCAFACAMARWRGTTSAYVMTEGAATPNAYRLAGRSPAVGWFTTVHPLVLPVDPGASVLDCLPAVVDRVRSVPNDGVGYGILRHLTPDSPALTQLRSWPEPEALVIHASHGGSGFDSGVRLLRNRHDLFAVVRRRLIECFPLVLTTTVTEGAMHLGVVQDGRYGEEEIESLADEVVRAFAELAE